MILQLQANLPALITHFSGVVTIYVRQYGAGNLRLGMNKEDLINTNPTVTPPGGIVDGIPQAAANGVQQYFWSGDLWVITDVAGPVMILAPAMTTYLDRKTGPQNPSDRSVSQRGGNLSTYQYG
jgi:hypothetical protein